MYNAYKKQVMWSGKMHLLYVGKTHSTTEVVTLSP